MEIRLIFQLKIRCRAMKSSRSRRSSHSTGALRMNEAETHAWLDASQAHPSPTGLEVEPRLCGWPDRNERPARPHDASSEARDNRREQDMIKGSGSDRRPRRDTLRTLLACASGMFLMASPLAASSALGQSPPSVAESTRLPANWRDVKDGVGGFPAGPMLEIALRRTHSDKLEMFKWRSEFIAMLSAQPGPLIEREWHSIKGIPENTGAGTWTGMTWWENQQRWQDMGNMLFPTPIADKWLKTLDMTMLFVKPLDNNFDLHTLAQSGGAGARVGRDGRLSDVGRRAPLLVSDPATGLDLSRRSQEERRHDLPVRRLSESRAVSSVLSRSHTKRTARLIRDR